MQAPITTVPAFVDRLITDQFTPGYSWSLQRNVPETDSARLEEIAVEDGSGAQASIINEVRLIG